MNDFCGIASDPLLSDGLELTTTGEPARPLIVLDLDSCRDATPAQIGRVAAMARESLSLVVAVLHSPMDPRLGPILSAATLTLTEHPESEFRELVRVEDTAKALTELRTAVSRSPCAAVACGQLLRQTAVLDTGPALAAEAAVYSMLLGGPEFAHWLTERGPAKPALPHGRDLIRLQRADRHLSIVLDRPDRRNALDAQLREELLAAAQLAIADPDITTVQLSGAGPAFCSGGDLDEFGSATDPVAAYLVRLDRAPWRVFDRLADRLVVRTHGACVGAGAELAAFGGTVTAAPGTYFRFPEVRMGLIPGAGGTVSVPRRIGRWRAAWAMLTGVRLDTSTALRWGLIDQVEHDHA
ncbi:enoyl-CoA hydratase/isomerase family protein [Nocardia sp. NPDC006630]|uniref:enoyl-CoA hydratase/isomerase family protein n=1 Tax=Nocardia sp. NPDC006630 TaxID=3157181 RepID=UPI0033BDD708